MKKNKLLLTAIATLTIFGASSCNSNKDSSETSVKAIPTTMVDKNYRTYGNSLNDFNAQSEDEIVNELIDSLISKGGDLITGGITTYGKSIVLNLLKECGFDFRDATTKTLEKIQQQLSVIESKIDALAKREEQMHSETLLNPILRAIQSAQKDYTFAYVVGGLGALAELENDPTKSEEEIETARKVYFNDTVSKLMIDGKPFASYVRDLADEIYMPNMADLSKDIFYYYSQTLGTYDTWSTLKIRNMRNFMAHIDTTLVTCANLAKFQIYYMTLDKDVATVKTYENIVNQMVDSVNAVNAKFKEAIEALKPLEEKRDAGINIYLPTNKEYARRMATLTFDLNDKVGDDSRNSLYIDYYTYSDGSYGDNDRSVLQFVPDQNFVSSVASDYRTYASAFYNEGYTIKDYLRSAGFYANNEELFNKSLGLYNANSYSDGQGFMNEDYEITATYYNDDGNYTRKPVYKIDSYHDWLQRVTRTVLQNKDENNYYLCFATPNGDKLSLDGNYESLYLGDRTYTLNKALNFKKYFYDCLANNRNHAWYLHDCW